MFEKKDCEEVLAEWALLFLSIAAFMLAFVLLCISALFLWESFFWITGNIQQYFSAL